MVCMIGGFNPWKTSWSSGMSPTVLKKIQNTTIKTIAKNNTTQPSTLCDVWDTQWSKEQLVTNPSEVRSSGHIPTHSKSQPHHQKTSCLPKIWLPPKEIWNISFSFQTIWFSPQKQHTSIYWEMGPANGEPPNPPICVVPCRPPPVLLL